ncbi:NAD(P)-binding protein [Comamonas endophytica]|uniref:NAD(P)-binding protein n=1 Tax=Comamonas endophytica TaxID=2949090 RepID=A0ABY6GA26_9BURK|nr:NAD(P)-binding protein [Acidovorax sp. 5MLIR]UYG51713.1 NAD(P)-binding protein [Acidovorax sp. 5MLIR]
MSHLLLGGEVDAPAAVAPAPAELSQPQPALAADDTTAHCAIAIIGGGVAGLHTALRLAERFGPRLCLFEQDACLGGRVSDIPASDEQAAGPFVQLGARRIMEGQSVLTQLAEELGIPLQKPEMLEELGFTRGMYATNNDEFIRVFPGLDVDRSRGGYEIQLYEKLLRGPERRHVDDYPNLRAYAEKVIGAEGCAFLHGTYRFRADHEYDLSAKAYLDYLDEENDAGAICPSGHCQSLYPVGGMSAYTRGMEQRVRDLGCSCIWARPCSPSTNRPPATSSRRRGAPSPPARW